MVAESCLQPGQFKVQTRGESFSSQASNHSDSKSRVAIENTHLKRVATGPPYLLIGLTGQVTIRPSVPGKLYYGGREPSCDGYFGEGQTVSLRNRDLTDSYTRYATDIWNHYKESHGSGVEEKELFAEFQKHVFIRSDKASAENLAEIHHLSKNGIQQRKHDPISALFPGRGLKDEAHRVTRGRLLDAIVGHSRFSTAIPKGQLGGTSYKIGVSPNEANQRDSQISDGDLEGTSTIQSGSPASDAPSSESRDASVGPSITVGNSSEQQEAVSLDHLATSGGAIEFGELLHTNDAIKSVPQGPSTCCSDTGNHVPPSMKGSRTTPKGNANSGNGGRASSTRKRKKADEGDSGRGGDGSDDDRDDGADSGDEVKRTKLSKADRKWSCHFFARNPEIHRERVSCYKNGFPDISDVL
ncbi:hypothetical protein ABW19_dt0203308 [Dactylella cylindrospora]|nr:hypothetical protein ABW19_dt0203308 [Dactylella cylindrospora]